MLRRATILLFMACLLPGLAWAQERVTIREINQIPPENIEQLEDAGADLTASEIEDLIQSDVAGETVTFTAVVISNPRVSGLASPEDDGTPGRIHVFVRDTSAASLGPEGMTIQVVQDPPAGFLQTFVGDVVEITGTVTYFGATVQIDPQEFAVLGSLGDLGLPETLVDPVTVTTAEVNEMLEGGVQTNWEEVSALNNQFVRFENATVLNRTIADQGRPNWIFSTDGGDTYVENRDISLRYRNDRPGYSDQYEVRDPENPFRPPPIGATINVQGFLVFDDFQGFSDQFPVVPAGAPWLKLSPMVDDDLEIIETPTVRSVIVDQPETVPGTDPVTITAEVDAQEGTVADVVLRYTTSATTDTTDVPMTDAGDGTYTADISGVEDGAFVSYLAEVTDTDGAVFTSFTRTYRALADGIDEIEDIQFTQTEGEGPSPFEDFSTTMDVTATVQTDPATGIMVIQDDVEEPWSGVYVQASEEVTANVSKGDVITINEARIFEAEIAGNLSVTTLELLDYSVDSQGDALGYLTMSDTGVLQDRNIAEQYEGMMLRFEDVVVTDTNPDGPDGDFGEFSFATQGSTDALRVDDESAEVPYELNKSLEEGQELDFIQGAWFYSFGNFKLVPEVTEDVAGISLAAGDEGPVSQFALGQNHPNPFAVSTQIAFTLDRPAQVNLAVYDVLGRRVAVLVDQRMPAGDHTTTFTPQSLPSGPYFYRLQAGDNVADRQMVLVK